MEWVREEGKWKGKPSMESAASQMPPADSQHLCWASAGQFQIALLRDGDKLSQDAAKKYTLNETPLGTDHIVAEDCPKNAAIRFEVEGGDLRLVLLDGEGGLVGLAKKTKSTRICVKLGSLAIEFSPGGNAQWSAKAQLSPNQLPTKLSVAGNTESLNISWLWIARSPGLFAMDGKGKVVEAQASGDRSQKAGIILDSQIPAGLTINKEWSVQPLSPHGTNGYRGTLHGPTGEVTLLEVEEAAKAVPLTFEGTGYKAAVNTSGWPYYQKRYLAILEKGRVEPNLNDDVCVSGYGPKHPYYIGAGLKQPGGAVKRLSGQTAASYSDRSLQDGLLPAPQAKKDFFLFIREEDRQSVVVGILVFACEVPAGKWEPAQRLTQGDHIVSWRGLVDEAKVTSITLDGASRHVLLFKNGLEFQPEMWLAAPFLGIATTRNAMWWGDAKHPETSQLSYRKNDNKWLIKGRWIGMDLTAHQGVARDAAVSTGPCTLAFICMGDPNAASGPILQVNPGGTPPKLMGWIADANGKVELNGAQLAFVNELESGFRLGPQSGLEEFTGPENIKEALRSARESPNDPEGVFQGVHWRRHDDGALEAWDAKETGVYVLTRS